MNRSKLLYTIMLFLAAIWCVFIIAAPVLSSHQKIMSSGMIYYFFSNLCHQIPERSFMLCERQFAVCSRCTGIYSGFLIGVLLFPIIKIFKTNFQLSKKYFWIMLVPITLDVFISISGLWQNTFTSRYFTGFILGSSIALLLVPGIYQYYEKMEGNHGFKTG
ncbi:DUF2085 domain-containing protein [candidate division KSB1 bacterium]|nr:DUF2085 domain-containing protein [candidate division KSB1 bacterium]